MNDFRAALGSFFTLAIVVPIAIVLGYMLATGTGGLDYTTLFMFALVAFGLLLPILLRWHHPLLIFSWNMSTVVFFLPGSPNLWLVMSFVSLGFLVLQRAVDANKKMLHSPSITLPLLVLALIVIMTGYYRGGLGVRSLGAEAIGGKRYWLILGAIVGYLAMSGRQVPRDKAWVYVGLFFLGGLTNLLADAVQFTPQSLWFIFWMFPVDPGTFGGGSAVLAEGIGRYYGLSVACLAFCFYFMARYGIRGMLSGLQSWRFGLFLAVGTVSLFGGFRTFFILAVLSFMFFYLFEGLLKSKYTPLLFSFGLLGMFLIAMFPQQLPQAMQRAVSFLPLDINPAVRAQALASNEWRLNMWRTLLPEIPEYLIIGKGYTMNAGELELMAQLAEHGSSEHSSELARLAGDYHNGPLSVQIPFGIFGSLSFVWFLIAAGRGLYLNWRHGDAELAHANAFLFALFLARVILFFVVFGGFYGDLAHFAGLIGFSLSLNGGICKPAQAPVVIKQAAPVRARLPLPRAPLVT